MGGEGTTGQKARHRHTLKLGRSDKVVDVGNDRIGGGGRTLGAGECVHGSEDGVVVGVSWIPHRGPEGGGYCDGLGNSANGDCTGAGDIVGGRGIVDSRLQDERSGGDDLKSEGLDSERAITHAGEHLE